MGKHKHDILWLVFHKISYSAPFVLLFPQHGGKASFVRLICGRLAEIRGEPRIHSHGTELSLHGLGDGDHPGELSLFYEGSLVVIQPRSIHPLWIVVALNRSCHLKKVIHIISVLLYETRLQKVD